MSPQTMHTLFVLIQVGPVLLILVAGSFLVSLAFKKHKHEQVELEIRQLNALAAVDAGIITKDNARLDQEIRVQQLALTKAQRQSLMVSGDVHIPGADGK